MDKMEKSVLSFVLTVVFVVLISCRGIFADEAVARKSLKKQGYTKIHVIDKSFFMVGLRGCGESDAAKFTVKAVNPVGELVEVYVCAGWPFKGATIRTD